MAFSETQLGLSRSCHVTEKDRVDPSWGPENATNEEEAVIYFAKPPRLPMPFCEPWCRARLMPRQYWHSWFTYCSLIVYLYAFIADHPLWLLSISEFSPSVFFKTRYWRAHSASLLWQYFAFPHPMVFQIGNDTDCIKHDYLKISPSLLLLFSSYKLVCASFRSISRRLRLV